eukprot:scaffold73082_cov36-Cyclotella_meneghiniana.AAC.1
MIYLLRRDTPWVWLRNLGFSKGSATAPTPEYLSALAVCDVPGWVWGFLKTTCCLQGKQIGTDSAIGWEL